MAAIPGDLDTDRQPPMAVPLRHFLVGLAFLLAGVFLGLLLAVAGGPGLASLAHVHMLLVGWICITIMGAMTQFVPVWSGVPLYSRRLAELQLSLVVAGLVGFVAALLTGSLAALPLFGALLLAGFWVFVYNVGRTLRRVEAYDVTERHFLLALGFFLVLTALGLALAVDFSLPVLDPVGLRRPTVLAAHATLAVFGVILTTVYGALYQLGTTFTQTELHGIDLPLQRVESVGHPVGVVCLTVGRLGDWPLLAGVGGGLVVVAALCLSTVLGRKLLEMRVDWTPMHTRYAVAVPALALWALLTIPAWIGAPTSPAHRFGAPDTAHLLGLGAIGFVVFGTLYHIVPFIVWVHQYSDLLGFEPGPMVDDLYRDDVATVDGVALVGGTGALVLSAQLWAPAWLRWLGGSLVCLGTVAFVANMLWVTRFHSPHSLGGIILGTTGSSQGEAPDPEADGSRDVSD